MSLINKHAPILEAHGPYIVAKRGETTVTIADCTSAPYWREYVRLFAASRDMLEALEAVVRVADRDTDEFDKARAAIARATTSDLLEQAPVVEAGARDGDDSTEWREWFGKGFEAGYKATLTRASEAQAHTDDTAVDSFARAMKEKMAQARAKGRSGWEQCNPIDLSRMLREHVEKGDPRDVANFCMMLWYHGTSIARASEAAAGGPVAKTYTREEVQDWRNDALEAAAVICDRYGLQGYGPAHDIRLLKKKLEAAPQPASEPVGYVMAADLEELAQDNGAVISPKTELATVPLFRLPASEQQATRDDRVSQIAIIVKDFIETLMLWNGQASAGLDVNGLAGLRDELNGLAAKGDSNAD